MNSKLPILLIWVLFINFIFFPNTVLSNPYCLDCPVSKKSGTVHFYGYGTAFHCKQIRRLRIRVKDLESALDTLENKVNDKEQKLWEEINCLKALIQNQSQIIQSQQEEIDRLNSVIGLY